MSENSDILDTLVALKEGKRVVENKLHSVLLEKSSLTQSKSLLEVKNTSLEERLQQVEYENMEQSEILASIQQNLIEQTSEYESKMNEMQMELDRRLDEINNSKNEDVEDIKTHYLKLFNEKASEVMNVRGELEEREESLESVKHKCKDLEYREQELNDIVNKLRECKDDSQTKVEIETYITHTKANTDILNDKLIFLKNKFDILKANEYSGRQQLINQIDEMRNMICDKDIQIFELQQSAKNAQIEKTKFRANHILESIKNDTDVIFPNPQINDSLQLGKNASKNKDPSMRSLKIKSSSPQTNKGSPQSYNNSTQENMSSPQTSDNKNIPKAKEEEGDVSLEEPVQSCSLEDTQCDTKHSTNSQTQNKNKRKKKKKKSQYNQF